MSHGDFKRASPFSCGVRSPWIMMAFLVCRLVGCGRFLLEEAALDCVLYRSLTARWVTMGMEWEATKPKPKWAKVFISMWIWESPNSTHFFPDIYLLSCCYVNRKYKSSAIGSRQIGPQKQTIGLWTVGPLGLMSRAQLLAPKKQTIGPWSPIVWGPTVWVPIY